MPTLFGPALTYAAGFHPNQVAVADLNGPGTGTDLVVGTDGSGIAVLGPTPPVVTAALASDTGFSASDHITSDDMLTGTADPGLVVTLTSASTTLGTVTADTLGNWSFTPTLADGSYSVTARQTDLNNATGSTTLSFTLDTTPPAVTAALLDDTGSGAANAYVTILSSRLPVGGEQPVSTTVSF